MEDFELKNLWREGNKTEKISEQTLDEILRHKSDDVLSKMRRKTKRENIMNIVATVVFTGLLLAYDWQLAIFAGVILTLITIYFHRLYRQLDYIAYSENTLEYLYDVRHLLHSYFRHYSVSMAVVTLMSFCGSALYQLGLDDFEVEKPWVLIISLLVGLIICAVLVYLFVLAWYGRPVKKLDRMIRELEEGQ